MECTFQIRDSEDEHETCPPPPSEIVLSEDTKIPITSNLRCPSQLSPSSQGTSHEVASFDIVDTRPPFRHGTNMGFAWLLGETEMLGAHKTLHWVQLLTTAGLCVFFQMVEAV